MHIACLTYLLEAIPHPQRFLSVTFSNDFVHQLLIRSIYPYEVIIISHF